MYKLKETPLDFQVFEIPLVVYESIMQESGEYLILKLIKKNWNTISAIHEIAKYFGLNSRDIGFAGTKDKQAITSQYLSLKIRGKASKFINKSPIKINEGLLIEVLCFYDSQLSLGDLVGNKFLITVRNLQRKQKIGVRRFFVNYFDEQRFSTNNVEIGRAIIKKDFKKAAKLIDDPNVKAQLAEDDKDVLKALLKLPKKIIMLYIHAYQSFLWNESVSRYLYSHMTDDSVFLEYSQGKLIILSDENLEQFINLNFPLVGALEIDASVPIEIKKIIDEILVEEGIGRFDFILKQMPYMTQIGSLRKVVSEIKNLKVGKIENDELNIEKYKQKINFELDKGSYATMAIKFLMNDIKK